MTDRLGTVARDGDTVTLRYERLLAHPAEKVWRALTESEHLRHWFPADVEGERRAGADLVFRFWPETATAVAAKGDAQAAQAVAEQDALPGKLVSWEPPRLLEQLWDTERIRYELTPEGDGTLLVLTVWLDGGAPPESAAGGYHACLDALEELLDTGSTPGPVAARDTSALEERYRALVQG